MLSCYYLQIELVSSDPRSGECETHDQTNCDSNSIVTKGCSAITMVRLVSFYTHHVCGWFELNSPKLGKHFPVREKLGNFVQTRKIGEIYPQHWKSMENDQINKLQKMRMFISYVGKNIFCLAWHTSPNLHTFKCHFYYNYPLVICLNVKIKTWILVCQGYIK